MTTRHPKSSILSGLPLAACLLSAIHSSGCIVRTAADSVVRLNVEGAESEVVYGLKQMDYIKTDAGVIIVGRGWHHREHETYAFFACEPYPAGVARYIILRPRPGASSHEPAYDLVLLVEAHAFPQLAKSAGSPPVYRLLRFDGQTSAPKRDFFGRQVLDLEHVKMKNQSNPTATVWVRGRIVATGHSDKAQKLLNWLGLLGLTQEITEFFRKDIRVKDVAVSLWTPDVRRHNGIQDAWYMIRVEKALGVAETERQIIVQVLARFGLKTCQVEPKYNEFHHDRLVGIIEVPADRIVLPGDRPSSTK